MNLNSFKSLSSFKFPSSDDFSLSSKDLKWPFINNKSFRPRSNSLFYLKNHEILSFPLFYSRFKKVFIITKSNLLLVQARLHILLENVDNIEEKILLKELFVYISDFIRFSALSVLKEECKAFVEKVKELEQKLKIGGIQEILKISLKTNTSPRLQSPTFKGYLGNNTINSMVISRQNLREIAIVRTFTWLRFSVAELLNFSLVFSIFYLNVEPNFPEEELNLKKILRKVHKEELFLEIMTESFASDLKFRISSRNIEDLKAFLGLKMRKWLDVNRLSLQKTIEENLDSSHKLICRLCDSYIKAEFMKIHSDICHQLIEYKKTIIQIEQCLAINCNTAYRIQQKLFQELESFKKRTNKRILKSQASFQLTSPQINFLAKKNKRNSRSFDNNKESKNSPIFDISQIAKSAIMHNPLHMKNVKSLEQLKDSMNNSSSSSLSGSPCLQNLSPSPQRNTLKPSIFKGSPKGNNPALNLIIPSLKNRPKSNTLTITSGLTQNSNNNNNNPPKRRPDAILIKIEEDNKEIMNFEVRSFQIPTISNALNSVVKYRLSLSKGMKIGDLTNELLLKKELEISLKELREKSLEAFFKKILEKIEEKLHIQWKIDALESNERKQMRALASNQGLKSQSSPSFKKAKTNRRFSNTEGTICLKSISRSEKDTENKNTEMKLETVEEIGSSMITSLRVATAFKLKDQIQIKTNNSPSLKLEDSISQKSSNSDSNSEDSLEKEPSLKDNGLLFGRKNSNAFGKYKKFQSETNLMKIDSDQEYSIGIKDFTFLRFLGKGAYGGVYLVRKKGSGDLYAMKIVNIETLDEHKMENFRAERNAIELVEGDFIVKAYYFFKHKHYICFVLEYMCGGDLSSLLKTYTRLDNETAKFYAAELVLAIESLHRKGIIHRDLKPENVLLDAKGHIKLADFGLSEVGVSRKIKGQGTPFLKSLKKVSNFEENVEEIKLFKNISCNENVISNKNSLSMMSKGNSYMRTSKPLLKSRKGNRIVGTPDYIPPEVLKGDCISNPTIDWWSLGVILYELIVGVPPFNDETVPLIFENILERRFEWPDIGDSEDCMTENAMDLINKLLEIDYSKRFGSRGFEEIKKHRFFEGINWGQLRNIKAPINDSVNPQNFFLGTEKIEGLGELLMGKTSVNKDLIIGINKELQDLTRFDLLSKLNEEDAEKFM